MADTDDQLQANTYIWSQSSDQITISFLVPESYKGKDLEITIEHQYVKAGVRGQEPVLKVTKHPGEGKDKGQECLSIQM